jgi:RNA polymerase sigma-70 factor (ECF subfamily)
MGGAYTLSCTELELRKIAWRARAQNLRGNRKRDSSGGSHSDIAGDTWDPMRCSHPGMGDGGIDVESYYQRYGPMVFRRCRRLLGSEESAMDAMQEVFINLIHHQHRLAEQAPSGLLLRMATNVSLNRIRASKRAALEPAELLDRIAGSSDEESPSIARSILRALFQREPESSRTIAVMHLVDGLTLEEVAAEVGMSISGVRKRLRKLREQLHQMEEATHA